MLSFLHPTPLSLTTPPELKPYGWTTTDLWCAPLVTGLYALLTHAQPFWADLHVLISEFLLGYQDQLNYKIQNTPTEPLDPELARVICAMLLAGMFVTRTVKNLAAPSVISIQDKENPRAAPKAILSIPLIISRKSSNRPPSASTRSQCSLDIAIVISGELTYSLAQINPAGQRPRPSNNEDR